LGFWEDLRVLGAPSRVLRDLSRVLGCWDLRAAVLAVAAVRQQRRRRLGFWAAGEQGGPYTLLGSLVVVQHLGVVLLDWMQDRSRLLTTLGERTRV
jgi:hypothetical protein